MKLNIKTTRKKAYRQIVEIIRSIPPLDTLRNRELDVLAILMYYNNKYKDVDEDIRWRVINDTSTKREMQREIEMSEDIFNNNISLVRKAGLIDKEGKIPKFLQIPIDNKYYVNFNFEIHEDDI
jgi:hypothetical protein